MKHFKSLKKILALVLSAVLLAAPLSGCFTSADPTKGSEKEAQKPDKKDDKKDDKNYVQEPENWAEHMNVIKQSAYPSKIKISSFDEDLLAYLSETTEGNYMASPLSFRYALGLLLAGAEGETKAELLRALSVTDEQEWIDSCLRFNGFVEYYGQYFQDELARHREYVERGYIPADDAEPFMALRVANSVWRNEELNELFTENYTEKVSKNYAAEYRTFLPENVVKKVNEWASTKTEKMIEKLLPEDYDTTDLDIILMNALYFKDNWLKEFYEGATEEGDFTTKTGAVTKKEFMHQEDHFSYYADASTQLVILPMKGGVNMAFVLGDTTNIAEKINKAEDRKVDLKIPKMDLETSFDQGELVNFLKERGVELAFDRDHADFSGMIDIQVYVSDIIQKTRIKLDEEGVEAAAVTAMIMVATGLDLDEPVPFYADRPFSFYIYANTNGEMATMFAGRIVE